MTRASTAFSDRIISGDTRRLFLWGNDGTRYCEREDSNGRYIRGVLLEPTASQLCRYTRSHDLWGALRCTVPTTNDTAPDGSATADVLHEDATGASSHYITAPTTAALAVTSYVHSCFVQAINRTWVCLFVDNIASGVYVNLSTGATYPTGVAAAFGAIAYGGGIYRGWHRFVGQVLTPNVQVYIAEGNGDVTFDGLNQDSLRVWGSQLEAGLYPSSHIINDGVATVARAVDGVVQRSIEPIDTGTLRLKVMLPSYTPAADTLLFHLVNAADSATKYVKLWVESGTGKLKVTAQGGGSAIPTTVITDGLVHDLSVSFTRSLLAAWVDSGVAATSSCALTALLDRIEAQPCGGIIGDFTLWDAYRSSGGGY